MFNKIKLMVLAIGLALSATAGFIGYGVWHSTSSIPAFDSAGYILQGGITEVKQLAFAAGSTYAPTLSGEVKFTSTDGNEYNVPQESFVHLDNNATMALSDAVLLDFDDLTDNFINNYYIQAGLQIQESGGIYTAETSSGTMQFGEHILKLSDKRYIVEAPTLEVSLNGDEAWDVEDYVQVYISEDGIVYLLTPENMWMTISEDCYIETEGGVRIHPVTQIIDDGTYKLSLAKLAVNMDDAIVLTEDETRRQIVPELNITAIDGAAGANGENGQTGAVGETGEMGETGETGEAGQEGQVGETGETGKTGEEGARGQAGRTGATGLTGKEGPEGGQGTTGGTGPGGSDAKVESSTNNAIPTMSITDWQVSATGVKGTIKISDPSGMLGAMQEQSTSYPGKITITNVETGQVIYCYETDSSFKIQDPDSTGFEDFYTGDGGEVFFSTKDDPTNPPLTPDTEYEMSVTAYYTSTDDAGLVYSREFINRVFYTDSTGISLNRGPAGRDYVRVTGTLSDAYEESVASVRFFLLTPAQNESFTQAAAENISSGAGVNFVDYGDYDITTFTDGVREVEFAGLEPNREFVVRAYVTTKAGLKVLTRQEAKVMTLKRQPGRVDANAIPEAFYNRQTGAFEVYRPATSDPDGGAVSYTYSAYKIVNGQRELVTKRTIGPSAGEPVQFKLSTGVTYEFDVEMEFFDNEKTLNLNLGTSKPIKAEGTTMPGMTLGTPEKWEYNAYTNKIYIELGNSALVTNDPNRPVEVELYADSLMNNAIKVQLKNDDPVTLENSLGKMSRIANGTNQVQIQLELENLYKYTNYAVTVYGWLDLQDGNGPQYRAIGTVTFETYNTMELIAYFTDSDTDSAMTKKLRLAVVPGDADDTAYQTRAAYARRRLMGDPTDPNVQGGQVTVVLYRGIGPGKLELATANFTDPADLEKLFGEGLDITESHFGNPPIDANAQYTLTILRVSDSSYKNTALGYVNTYDEVRNNSGNTAGTMQPPDLLDNPDSAIDAQPIYNKNMGLFGLQSDANLPEDAIMGYTLASSYDNVQRIGKKITYYAYELSAFTNAMKNVTSSTNLAEGETPLKRMSPIMTMSQSIGDQNSVPKVAVLFGNDPDPEKSDVTTDATAKGINGYMVYYAGNANLAGSTLSGMGRGFRYVFAYEVEYQVSSGTDDSGAVTSITKQYPYDHSDYDNYQGSVGGFKDGMGTKWGDVYVLRSGICAAPRILPDFHVYVAKSNEGQPSGYGNIDNANGSLTLHYTWRDPEFESGGTPQDMMVVPYNDEVVDKSTCTILTYDGGKSDKSSSFLGEQSLGNNWYEVTLLYTHTNGDRITLEPKLNISKYRIPYTRYVSEVDDSSMSWGPFPLDWGWESVFSSRAYEDQLVLSMVPNYGENHIRFNLLGVGSDQTLLRTMASRAAMLEVTFNIVGDPNKTKVIRVPIQYEKGTTTPYFFRVPTGDLGTEYLHKDYTVTNAKLYYDGGGQGWSLADTSSKMVLVNNRSASGFGSYVGSTEPNIAASGGVRTFTITSESEVQGATLTEALRNTINQGDSVNAPDPKKDAKVRALRDGVLENDSGSYSYLYPTAAGVNSGSDSATTSLTSNSYSVPKSVAVYPFSTFKGEDNLTTMTPMTSHADVYTSVSSVYLSGLKVQGFETNSQVWIRLYADEDAANGLSNSDVVMEKEFTVNASTGEPVGGSHAATFLENTSLTAGATYWVTLHYYDEAEQRNRLLLDTDDNAPAVYEVTLRDGNDVHIVEVEYTNASYLEKNLKVRYSLSMINQQKIRFDFFSTKELADAATPADGGDVLNHEEMETAGFLVRKNTLEANSNNTVDFNLRPLGVGNVQRKLQPGVTYYLKITAYEGEGENLRKSGDSVQAITFPPVGNIGTVITTTAVSPNSVTYRVTIVDNQYSLMGKDKGALYAVRFTDPQGRHIQTKYDDQVYEAFEQGNLQRVFVLNSDSFLQNNIFQIQAGQMYTINVYAVPDYQHNGNSTFGKSWADLFDQAADAVSGFMELIKKFFKENLEFNTDYTATEGAMRIGQFRQSTTTEDGYLIDEDRAYLKRATPNTKIQLVLDQSYGLFDAQGNNRFKQIKWTVEGLAHDGTAQLKSGEVRMQRGDTLLQQDASGVPYYLIPEELPLGNYTVTVEFRLTEGSADYNERISARIYDN